MSLLDMMNFSLQGFTVALTALSREVREAARHKPDDVVSDNDKNRVIENLQYIAQQCQNLALNTAEHRLQRCFLMLTRVSKPIYAAVASELVILNQAINDDIKYEYFYHYPRTKALVAFVNIAEWLPIYDAFPSSRIEIEEGLDCYASGHPTACIFHMMRVAELGMRALARERKVTFPNHPLEWVEWQNVIDQIESKAKVSMTGISRGPVRDAATAFYTGAVAQLRALRETRNRVMHMRGPLFDDLDAQQAMNRVRDLMTGLCRKIGEKTRRPIPLSRWP